MSKKEHLNPYTNSDQNPIFNALKYNSYYAEEKIREIINNNDKKINLDTIINDVNEEGRTPIFLVAERGYGYLKIAKLLIEQGAKLKDVDNSKSTTPLHVACYSGHPETVEYLLSLPDIEIDAVDEDNGYTPLHYACDWRRENNRHFTTISSKIRCIELLLEKATEQEIDIVDAQDSQGLTPLARVIESQYTEHTSQLNLGYTINAFTILIENNANLNLTDMNDSTILHYVCHYSQDIEELLQLLIDNNANIDALHNGIETPLMIAVSRGQTNNIALLLESGADTNIRGFGNAPILFFVLNNYGINSEVNRAENMQLLLDYGVNPNAQDANGNTVLHKLKDDDIELAKMLLKSNADINILNKSGETALRGFSENNKIFLSQWYKECYEEIGNLRKEHNDHIENISSEYDTKILKKELEINKVTRERNNTYATLKDMKNTQLIEADKKSHDAFQELKQYDKKYSTILKTNTILFYIFLVLICIGIYGIKVRYPEVVDKLTSKVKNIFAEYDFRKNSNPNFKVNLL
tara:strand:+ start:1966 stop:3537 length:1572 start_codon:yes stop_codon:yes gene_type:complete